MGLNDLITNVKILDKTIYFNPVVSDNIQGTGELATHLTLQQIKKNVESAVSYEFEEHSNNDLKSFRALTKKWLDEMNIDAVYHREIIRTGSDLNDIFDVKSFDEDKEYILKFNINEPEDERLANPHEFTVEIEWVGQTFHSKGASIPSFVIEDDTDEWLTKDDQQFKL